MQLSEYAAVERCLLDMAATIRTMAEQSAVAATASTGSAIQGMAGSSGDDSLAIAGPEPISMAGQLAPREFQHLCNTCVQHQGQGMAGNSTWPQESEDSRTILRNMIEAQPIYAHVVFVIVSLKHPWPWSLVLSL